LAVFYYSIKDSYYFKTYTKGKHTDKGLESVHKIYSLGAFIKDFSNFVEKDIDQIVIWERYFSYA